MIYFKISIILICMGLNVWGGQLNHNMRRFVMPLVLALSSIWFAHTFWALTMLAACGTLCLGYGEKSPLRHIFGDAWARFVWMTLTAIAFSAGLFITGHLHVYFMVPYVLIAGVLGITIRLINDLIGDSIFGAWFASIVFLI
jgi:hypothetical protein